MGEFTIIYGFRSLVEVVLIYPSLCGSDGDISNFQSSHLRHRCLCLWRWLLQGCDRCQGKILGTWVEQSLESTNLQLIGLREKLQENPIFHGKIYGFL